MQFDFLLQGLFLRFPLAMIIVIYAFLNKLEGKRYSLLLLIIASTIHFGALISIPIYFLSRLSRKKLNIVLLISLLIIPFGSYIFIFLTSHLLEWFPNIPFKEKLNVCANVHVFFLIICWKIMIVLNSLQTTFKTFDFHEHQLK